MSIKPKHEIGMEIHPKTTQFIRIEKGIAKAIINDKEFLHYFSSKIRTMIHMSKQISSSYCLKKHVLGIKNKLGELYGFCDQQERQSPSISQKVYEFFGFESRQPM